MAAVTEVYRRLTAADRLVRRADVMLRWDCAMVEHDGNGAKTKKGPARLTGPDLRE